MHHVFVDSNVLGSKTQYDWMFMLRRELNTMFALSTSDDVLDEAHRVWRKRKHQLGGAMRAHREKLFRSNFNEISSTWKGQAAPVADIHDSHVHNAAVHLEADILLTNNVKDFGDPDVLPYDLYTPDEFFCLIYKNSPQGVRAVALEQVKYWVGRQEQGNSDRETKTLAEALVEAGCPEFAQNVDECLQFLSGLDLSEAQAEPEVLPTGAIL